MSDAYHHGIRFTALSSGTRSLVTVATAVIGIVATSSDAVADAFPLNRPVLVTDISAALSSAGALGTLATTLRAIADQVACPVVVVRVADGEGADDAAKAASLTANVIGTDVAGTKTGLQALLAAEGQLGVRPRIIGVPGLDNQAVTVALATLLPKLRAFGYAYANAASVADVLTYREQFSAKELMLIWPDFTGFDIATQTVKSACVIGRALGLRAQIDQTTGWHKTLSNVGVAGVSGLTADVHFDLQAEGTDADLLNGAAVTTLINMTGYRFWGSRTCADDSDYAFESAVRTSQVLQDTIAEGLAWAVDKPLHPSLGRDIVETINAKFRSYVAQGFLIGAKAWLNTSLNTSDSLRTGKMVIDYDFTPVPPLEDLELRATITDSYFSDFVAQAGTAVT